jgi:YihY family inner membrane protein
MSEAVPPPPRPKPSRMGIIWATCWRALVKYRETDGEQRAASFAYYAFFALLPLVVLFITIGTRFLGNEQQATDAVFRLISHYVQLDGSSEELRTTVSSFMRSRLGSGIISSIIVIWCAMRFFQALVHGVNRAWGTRELSWWLVPVKNMIMTTILGSALLMGIVAPAIINGIESYYFLHRPNWPFMETLGSTVFWLSRTLVPPLLLFYALMVFYKVAPRRKTTFREVWLEAFWVTLALGGLGKLFILFAGKAADFNRLYGTFGSVVALLVWIYCTGALILLGGCFCSARDEICRGLEDQAEPSQEGWRPE